MSKSLGNFYTIRDLVDKGYSPKAIRYALLSSHYRQKLNFTFERLDNAQRAINKLLELSRRLGLVKDGSIKGSAEYFKKTEKFLAGFNEHLSDDLNMSGALGEFFVWVNFIFKLIDAGKINVNQSKDALIKLSKVDSILGVMESDYKIDDKIKELIEARAIARKEKNWKKSDEIREKLFLLGIIIEDTPEGQVWKIK
jgi:cysteinyl-tRNA synthetase